MLFGESTDAAAAEQLLGTCMDAGVNFFDVAEMYPVPQRAETYGRSEEVLGAWLARRQRRAGVRGARRRGAARSHKAMALGALPDARRPRTPPLRAPIS